MLKLLKYILGVLLFKLFFAALIGLGILILYILEFLFGG